ncbi:DUF86 domain-containing protein [Aneurinibacillus tyrosinisolvens]|uniref:DUF86 domain-containing protein n=1 Tax=Aneurinibacillus tyrosinisolvens TaxID=1443435 RepID=UPI00063EE729|nr:HepT-like ribonuclease domain-containing protein [Aneurinibacillus tyrosinisolvens]
MYQVNVTKIEEILSFYEKVLADIEPIMEKNNTFPGEPVTGLALERTLHIALESIADVGNYLIDGFIMRDPGSYEDIVEILRDETVVTDVMAASLKEIVNRRKSLITEYTYIKDEDVFMLLKTHLPFLQAFPPSVRDYLKKELY